MTMAELNAKDRSGFVAAVGWAFEDSPWVAERVWVLRPFATLDGLHECMIAVVASASPEEQSALLRAHPELGAVRLKPDTTDDGRVRLRADSMSTASQREQSGAGLDTLTHDELDRLRALNAAYRDKFGFPFLYAVKGSTKHDILSALERRLPATRDAEQVEALRQVYRIARFRLEEVIS
jgi:2-oxo-4-hydroxy-4-carboxy-5-ureidoimidazoline decarboxylase